MSDFDLVIRGGTIFDGSGGEPFEADIAITGGRIAAIGVIGAAGSEEISAKGMIVTPGFVDIHTHYDGQATWDNRLFPSSAHGVTTVLMGNCGVGFAPCRPQDRERLVHLMEGVEDLPEVVLSEGLPWRWESFGSYLDFLDARHFDVDIATQIPHSALRVFVMGERGDCPRNGNAGGLHCNGAACRRGKSMPAHLALQRRARSTTVPARAGAFQRLPQPKMNWWQFPRRWGTGGRACCRQYPILPMLKRNWRCCAASPKHPGGQCP